MACTEIWKPCAMPISAISLILGIGVTLSPVFFGSSSYGWSIHALLEPSAPSAVISPIARTVRCPLPSSMMRCAVSESTSSGRASFAHQYVEAERHVARVHHLFDRVDRRERLAHVL